MWAEPEGEAGTPCEVSRGHGGSLSQPPGTATGSSEASWQCWRPKASLPRGWSKVEGIEQDAGLGLVSPDGGRGGRGHGRAVGVVVSCIRLPRNTFKVLTCFMTPRK